jgi:erythromycin esterase-like protein
MTVSLSNSIADDLSGNVLPLRPNETTDYDPLLRSIGKARFVLIGEASHGTHEFYRERAQITKRLITEFGFNAVAFEAPPLSR